MRKVFISGISGQDGSLLADLLLRTGGYKVYGGIRSMTETDTWRLEKLSIKDQVELVPFELSEKGAIEATVKDLQPYAFYNLASQSFVANSFLYSGEIGVVNAVSTAYILSALIKYSPDTRFFQASSAEIFGNTPVESPQNETSPTSPSNPYGSAKLYAQNLTENYRNTYKIFAAAAILYNHESELRDIRFLTRKVSHYVASYYLDKNLGKPLELGNLEACRDWGAAREYVAAMTRIVDLPSADTYILATGNVISVKELVQMAFSCVGVFLTWEGSGLQTIARNSKNGELLVKVNEKFYRPTDSKQLLGNPQKAHEHFGFQTKITVADFLRVMVETDIDEIKKNTC